MASTGAVATNAPKPPAASTQPLSAGNRAAGNHSTKALKLAIKQADTPKPIKPRPTINSSALSLTANNPAPAAANNSSVASTRRGPNRSSSMPSGS